MKTQKCEDTNQQLREKIKKLTSRVRKLESSESKHYRTLFEGIDDAVVVHDPDGQILDCNQAGCRRLGYTREELLKMHTWDIDTPEFGKGFKQRLQHQLNQGRHSFEGVHVTKDGRKIPVDINTSVIEYFNQKVVLAIMRDITKRKQAEEKLNKSQERLKLAIDRLKEAHQRLQLLDTMKSDFISIVSHDLRTPLTAIKNAASILIKGGIKKRQIDKIEKELLQIIINNTNRQTRLISDLLDISKIESGSMQMRMEDADLVVLLQEIKKSFQLQIEDKHIKQEWDLPESLPAQFDIERIRRVITNLIDNAIKFTPDQGEITIGLEDGNKDLIVSVEDTGVGIADEEQPHLFSKFYQAKSTVTQHKSGVGLGLVIAKGIVQSHGGKIGVTSKVGQGSKFYFSLPKL